jgi:adenosylhomocysteine nucleosidase
MSAPAPLRLGIVTALKEEQRAIRKALSKTAEEQARIVRGGVGAASAARAAAQLLEGPRPVNMLCSSGFCGGLSDGIQVGDVIVAGNVIAPEAPGSRMAAHPRSLDLIRHALSNANIRFHVGALAGSRTAVTRRADKRSLGLACGALAVDMESAAVARAAAQANIGLVVMRVISDSVLDELPAEVGGFLNEAGNVRVINVAKFALGGPRNIKTLWRLKSRTDQAVASLEAAWRAVWPILQSINIAAQNPHE